MTAPVTQQYGNLIVSFLETSQILSREQETPYNAFRTLLASVKGT